MSMYTSAKEFTITGPGLINADKSWLFMDANGAVVCVRVWMCVCVCVCVFAAVTRPDAPAAAAAAAWVFSHWLVILQLSPPP